MPCISEEFYILCTVHFVISLSQTNQCTRIINKYICNPYIRFDNQVAIIRGRIKESQVSMTSRYTYIWHYNGSTHTAHNIKM
jgi:hypothetical protein